MKRPEFLNCIMTPAIINRIRQEQEYYDEDPERYERQEKEREEQRQMEEEMMREEERRQYE